MSPSHRHAGQKAAAPPGTGDDLRSNLTCAAPGVSDEEFASLGQIVTEFRDSASRRDFLERNRWEDLFERAKVPAGLR